MPCIRHGARLLFCPDVIQPNTSVYSAFCRVNAIIPPTPQNSIQGFTGAFPAIRRVLLLLSGGAPDYTAPPAPRWSVSQHRSTSSAYQIPPPRRTLHRSVQPAYYNKVYKRVQGCATVVDPWQTVQHIADHASPAGSASPPVQGQPGGVSMLPTPGGWRSGIGSAVRAGGLAHSIRRGSPAAGGAEPLAASAASLFGLSPDS